MAAPYVQWQVESPDNNASISSLTATYISMANNNTYFSVLIPQGGDFGSNTFDPGDSNILNNIGIGKINGYGSTLWTVIPHQLIPLAYGGTSYAPVLATDKSEHVAVAFACTPPLPQGAGPFPIPFPPVSPMDIYVAQLGPDGTLQWVGDPAPINGTVSGGFLPNSQPQIVKGPTAPYPVYGVHRTEGVIPGGTKSGGTGSGDLVIWKYNNDGTIAWAYQNPTFNTPADMAPYGIVCDKEGNIYVTGLTTGTINGGSNPGGYQQVFVMKFHSTGDYIWGAQDGLNPPNANVFQSNITIDDNNIIYITYTTNGLIPGPGNVKTGLYDTVVIALDSGGTILWTKENSTFNTTSNDYYPTVTGDSSGVFLAYETTGVVSGGTKVGAPTSTNVVLAHFTDAGSVNWKKQDNTINSVGGTSLFTGESLDYENTQFIMGLDIQGGAPIGENNWAGGASTNIVFVAHNYTSPPEKPNIFIRPDAQDQKLVYFWEMNNSAGNTSSLRIVYNGASTFVQANSAAAVSGLTNGTLYDSYISALNSSGESGLAQFRSVRPGFIPDPVENVLAVDAGGAVRITWDPPATLPVASLLGYSVSNVTTETAGNTFAHQFAYDDLHPAPGAENIYVVQAVNDPGYSLGVSTSVTLAPIPL